MNTKKVNWYKFLHVRKAQHALFVVGLLSIIPVCNAAKFYSIKSPIEFYHKILSHEYSFVCFAHNDYDGFMIKNAMKYVANNNERAEEQPHLLGVLFVFADRESLRHVVDTYEWNEEAPLFLIVQSNGKAIAQSDLNGHYSVDAMERFVFEAIGFALQESYDRLCLALGYKADVGSFVEQEGVDSAGSLIERGYVPIEMLQVEASRPVYWWNRGVGNSRDGRGGLRYYDGEFRKKHTGRKVKKQYD